eukprot:1324470-Rhodomonas_salina.1
MCQRHPAKGCFEEHVIGVVLPGCPQSCQNSLADVTSVSTRGHGADTYLHGWTYSAHWEFKSFNAG